MQSRWGRSVAMWYRLATCCQPLRLLNMISIGFVLYSAPYRISLSSCGTTTRWIHAIIPSIYGQSALAGGPEPIASRWLDIPGCQKPVGLRRGADSRCRPPVIAGMTSQIRRPFASLTARNIVFMPPAPGRPDCFLIVTLRPIWRLRPPFPADGTPCGEPSARSRRSWLPLDTRPWDPHRPSSGRELCGLTVL